MADEIEIKLKVPPQALQAVQELGWLKAMARGPAKRERLRSVYFDTPKLKLRDRGIALRVRHHGRKRIQTVKSEGTGAFARNEWECEIEGDEPDLARLDGTPLAGKKLNLRPVFETDVTRIAIPIRSGESDLEVALDKGAIRTGRKREPVCEIEIELKSGDPAEVVRLTQRLVEGIAAAYEPRSKPERGYALSADESRCAVFARSLSLPAEATVGDAFRTIGMECLRHLSANDAAVRAAETEGLHQMRMGLRRLRAAMSIFKELLQDPESQYLRSEFKWLTEQLSPARDFDVVVKENVAPPQDAATEIVVLRKDKEKRHEAGLVRVRATVDADSYRKLVLETAFWLAQGSWSTADDDLLHSRPASSFASEILERQLGKIIKKAKKLKKLDAPERQKLRIAIKKLRYSAEFFASLFESGKARKRQEQLNETLEELQEALGRLNDFAMHQMLAGDIVKPDLRSEEAFAMGIVTGREQVEYEACVAAAQKAGGRLAMCRPFWN